MDEFGEAAHVGLVERSVDLVQDAERRGLELEDADQQRERGQRLFSAREQQDVLQLLARRRSDDVDAALVRILRVGELHEGLAAAKELREGHREVLVDDLEGLIELHARDVVDLLDRSLGILDRIKEVLALGFEKAVAGDRLVVLLKRHHVDRPHRLEPLLQRASFFLFSVQRLAFDARDGSSSRRVMASMPRSLRQVASMCSMSEASLAARAVRARALLAELLGLMAQRAKTLVELGHRSAQLGGFGGKTVAFRHSVGAESRRAQCAATARAAVSSSRRSFSAPAAASC